MKRLANSYCSRQPGDTKSRMNQLRAAIASGSSRKIRPLMPSDTGWTPDRIPMSTSYDILALGNSHTRQVLQEVLPCQYSIKQKVLTWKRPRVTMSCVEAATTLWSSNENQAKLHLVTNHALIYSRQWPRYLQELVNHTALIVGKMNILLPNNLEMNRRLTEA